MNNERSNNGMLTAALVLAVIGAAFSMIGGIGCLAGFNWVNDFGNAVGVGNVIPVEVWIWGIGATIGGVIAIVGAALVKKGGLIAPILLLVAAAIGIASIWIVNFMGLIGGALILISAILAFVARGQKTRDVDHNNSFNDNNFNGNI